MAIPLIPLIAGAAVGAVATYIYNDKSSRKALKKSIDITGKKFSEGADSIKSALKRNKTQTEETSEASEVKADEKPASSKRKTPVRKKAATKTVKAES